MRGFSLHRLHRGFTIVELLIVIVVIAILTAIAVVAFTGVQSRAEESKLQSDLRNAATLVQNDNTTSGSYPASESSVNGGKGFSSSSNTRIQYSQLGAGYCITATSTKYKVKSFFISQNTGAIQEGTCPGHEGSLVGIDLGKWTDISTGFYHSCGIYDSKAYCWGQGNSGVLGNSSTTNRSTPVAVGGLLAGKTVSSIKVGWYYTCAIADGQAYCWGNELGGKLGNGNTGDTYKTTPVLVGGLLAGKTVTDIAPGQNFACAVADGKAYCWGENTYGQLGNSNNTSIPTPVAVGGVLASKTVTDIESDGLSSCAVADGLMYCWGAGAIGRNVHANVPTAMAGSLSGKAVDDIDVQCGVSEAKLHCWGYSATGLLGSGTSAEWEDQPIVYQGLPGDKAVTQVSNGSYQKCVIAGGQLYCWGSGTNGTLGNGGTANSIPPVSVGGVLSGATVSHMSVDGDYACAISYRHAYCWGGNQYGQLGINNTTRQLLPAKVVNPL